MSSISDRMNKLWENARRGHSALQSALIIPKENIVPPLVYSSALQAHKHYFQIRINQLFLKYDREWFATFDPTVMVATDFLYGSSRVSVPSMVGPRIFESKGVSVPTGSIISDTRVAGLYPYRGGRISLKFVLYKTQRDNKLRQLLNLLENTAGAIDYGTALSQYLRIADAIVSGIEGLLGIGQTVPVLAYSKEFDPTAGDELAESYILLIDRPERELNTREFWVINNKLYTGSSPSSVVPYEATDFVLVSLRKTTERDDIQSLPFYPMWEQAVKEATLPYEGHWKLAKASLASLYQAMVLSPDLTEDHVTTLRGHFIELLQQRRQEAVELSSLSTSQEHPLDVLIRTQGAEILDL